MVAPCAPSAQTAQRRLDDAGTNGLLVGGGDARHASTLTERTLVLQGFRNLLRGALRWIPETALDKENGCSLSFLFAGCACRGLRPATILCGAAMFSRWGAFVYRRRRVVFVLAVLFGIAAGTAAGRASSVLSAGGWFDPGSESAIVGDRLAQDFGTGKSALIAVFRGPETADARSQPFQAQVAASLAGLASGTPTWRMSSGTRRRARTGSSAPTATGLRRRRPQGDRRESVPLLDRFERGGTGPATAHDAVGRLRSAGEGLERAVGSGPPARRDRVAAAGAPDPRVRRRSSRPACRCSWPVWRSRRRWA